MNLIRNMRKLMSGAVVAGMAVLAVTAAKAEEMTLRGASLFDNEHAYSKTLIKLGELVNKEYGKKVTFDLRGNSELGIEPDYVNFLTQGVAIDYAIIAPSNLARFAPSVPLMDMPFVFRDLDHWNAVLSSDVLKPLEEELLKKADLMIIGYAGGGARNLISSKKISNIEELTGHKMRVMGAPIQAAFSRQSRRLHQPSPIPKCTTPFRQASWTGLKTSQPACCNTSSSKLRRTSR